MKIKPILAHACYEPGLKGTTSGEVIAEMARLASGSGGVDAETIQRALCEREKLGSTALSDGVAIPHGKLKGLKEVVIVVGVHRPGLPFGALDGKDTHLFVGLLAPDNDPTHHLKVLARLARLLKEADCRSRLLECRTAEEMSQVFIDADDRVA